MLRSDIPQVLFSCIKEDDPYRASKVFQIERWCYANWRLHHKMGQRRHNFLAQILSSEDCWKKVDGLHGVRLDRQMVGKKLIMPPDSDNPFSTDRYKIACQCCLEEDIIALFEERKKRLSAQGKASLLEYPHLVRCLGVGPLGQFWSHFISGHISKLNLNGLHPYEYGLDCAMGLKQAEAVEFFWNKIKSLPEDELSAQQRDEIFMKTAVRAAGSRCSSYPEVFEFCFSQINPDKYPEFLKRDLAENGYYSSLSVLRKMLCFDLVQELFDYLEPVHFSDKDYSCFLWNTKLEYYSEPYTRAAVNLFMHMWMKEGFDSHRALVLEEEMMDGSGLQGDLLVPLVKKGYMEPVWAVLDKAGSDQIKEFMDSRHANHICSILKERGDEDSLNKFISYVAGKFKDLSTDLTEVKLSKTVGLSK